MNTSNTFDLSVVPVANAGSFVSQLALSLASPVIANKKIEAQVDTIIRSIEAKELAQKDIMYTIRCMSADKTLTNERFMALLSTYHHISDKAP